MVVGPIMQGIVLMGIIYWYSKGMMSVINDYYRSEFQRKLRDVNDTAAATATPTYDVNNIEDLLNVENIVNGHLQDESALKEDDFFEVEVDKKTMKLENNFEAVLNLKSKCPFVCYGTRNLAYFMCLISLVIGQEDVGWCLMKTNNLNEEESMCSEIAYFKT